LKKILAFVVIIITGALLVYGVKDFPKWADPNQPASIHVSPRYIEKTFDETAVPNLVTAILADYRGYDTMYETTVIFTAGIVVMMLLRRPKKW
jgi:multicomponent Na+:H+ antiporter subunit B